MSERERVKERGKETRDREGVRRKTKGGRRRNERNTKTQEKD